MEDLESMDCMSRILEGGEGMEDGVPWPGSSLNFNRSVMYLACR